MILWARQIFERLISVATKHYHSYTYRKLKKGEHCDQKRKLVNLSHFKMSHLKATFCDFCGMLKAEHFVNYRIKLFPLLVFQQAWKHLSSKVCEILEELRAVQVCMCACMPSCTYVRLLRHIWASAHMLFAAKYEPRHILWIWASGQTNQWKNSSERGACLLMPGSWPVLQWQTQEPWRGTVAAESCLVM